MINWFGIRPSHFKQFITSLVLLFAGNLLPAQTLNGDASLVSPGCWQLTSNTAWEVGSVYFPDTLNLNRPFNFFMHFNLGFNDQNGADGMVFVLQNNSLTALGPAGGSLGWFGIPNSLGIEFDTYPNPVNDPAYDHIAVFRDGEINHAFATHLFGPVGALPNNGNIEDGQHHLVQITYDPADDTLRVYFDCSLRVELEINLKDTIFGGDSLVHWGVSGAGGGAFNAHSFCMLSDTTGAILDTLLLCEGDTMTITAPASRDGFYTWNPLFNQAGSHTQSIEVWPTQDTLYTVEYIDPCGYRATDSLYFRVRPPLNPALAPDTTLCQGTSYQTGLALANGTFSWSTGSTDSSITVSAAGTYSVTATDLYGCRYQDSQQVSILAPPDVEASSDTLLCEFPANGLQISAGRVQADVDYSWSTGDTTLSITAAVPGTYVVQVSNRCGMVADTVLIGLFDTIALDLGNDTTICPGENYVLDPGLGSGIFLWSTGDMSDTLGVDSSGLFILTYQDTNGCYATDSLAIDLIVPPITVYAGLDITDCEPGASHVLEARPIQANVDYVWSTGDTSTSITVSSTADYVIRAVNECGEVSDTVIVFIYEYEEGYFIPNVFTPNGDGVNDVFQVENFRAEEYSLEIFDRWGNPVFSTKDRTASWDGNVNGSPAMEGVYFYQIRTRDCKGYLKNEQGTLTMLR